MIHLQKSIYGVKFHFVLMSILVILNRYWHQLVMLFQGLKNHFISIPITKTHNHSRHTHVSFTLFPIRTFSSQLYRYPNDNTNISTQLERLSIDLSTLQFQIYNWPHQAGFATHTSTITISNNNYNIQQ